MTVRTTGLPFSDSSGWLGCILAAWLEKFTLPLTAKVISGVPIAFNNPITELGCMEVAILNFPKWFCCQVHGSDHHFRGYGSTSWLRNSGCLAGIFPNGVLRL